MATTSSTYQRRQDRQELVQFSIWNIACWKIARKKLGASTVIQVAERDTNLENFDNENDAKEFLEDLWCIEIYENPDYSIFPTWESAKEALC